MRCWHRTDQSMEQKKSPEGESKIDKNLIDDKGGPGQLENNDLLRK